MKFKIKVAVIFLAVVLLGTVVSRFASSMLTPVVEAQYASSGTVDHQILADVMIAGDQETPVYVSSGIRIEEIYVTEGELVAKDDKLLRFNTEELEQVYLTKKLERKDMKMKYWYGSTDEKTLDEQKLKATDDELAVLETLVANDGIVSAEFGGMVSEVRQQVGTVSTEEAAFVIAKEADTYTLSVSITETQKSYVAVDDTVIVQGTDETSTSASVTALYEETGNPQHYIAEVEVSGETFHIGDSVLVDIMHSSKKYDFVIPTSAIRSDGTNEYVLVEREQDTLLGTEVVATKVVVKSGEANDSETGASSSALTSDDRIIISSDKKIEAGDVVREKD